MNKTVFVFILLLVISPKLFSQNLYNLIANNNYEGVKEYTGSLNVYNSHQTTPLMWAIYKSDLKMVKLLVSKGADAKMKSWISFDSYIAGSNFVLAARLGKIEILDYLLEMGYFNINEPEYKGYIKDLKCAWNALQTAAYSNNVKVISYLIKKGADINSLSETDANKTALLMAIEHGNIEAAMELINLGADVNIRDMFYNSSLEMAIERKEKGLVKAIYDKGFQFTEKRETELLNKLKKTFKVSSFEEL